jgi:hypothetical protein
MQNMLQVHTVSISLNRGAVKIFLRCCTQCTCTCTTALAAYTGMGNQSEGLKYKAQVRQEVALLLYPFKALCQTVYNTQRMPDKRLIFSECKFRKFKHYQNSILFSMCFQPGQLLHTKQINYGFHPKSKNIQINETVVIIDRSIFMAMVTRYHQNNEMNIFLCIKKHREFKSQTKTKDKI